MEWWVWMAIGIGCAFGFVVMIIAALISMVIDTVKETAQTLKQRNGDSGRFMG